MASRKRIQYQVFTIDPSPAVPSVETITEDKWHQPWSRPSRPKIAPALAVALAAASGAFAPVMIPQTGTGVFVASCSSPVIFTSRIVSQTIAQPVPFAGIIPEVITPDKWDRPLSNPVRQKPGLWSALQQTRAEPVLVPTAAPTAAIGNTTVSSQVSFKQRFIYQSVTQPVVFGETVTADKWLYPWSEPVRSKPGLKASLQQATAGPVLDSQQIIGTFESRWHQPWSEPVRLKRITTAQIPVDAFPAPVLTDAIESRWHQPWSDPAKPKPGLRADLQQSVAAPVAVVTALPQQVMTAAVSSQVIYKGRFIYQAITRPVVVETVTTDKWYVPLADPVRVKSGLAASRQQFLAFQLDQTQQPETVTESRWHQPWSEPVRIRRLSVAQFPAALLPPPVITDAIEARWHQPWSEPVKVKRWLPAYEQQFHTSSIVVELITADKWLYPWTLPTPRKPGLGAWQQQETAPATPIFPNLTTLIQWFSPLNDPVRPKKGLLAFLHRFFTESTEPITNITTVTISATEVNTDSALFGIAVYNQAVSAKVSVKEIPAIKAAVASIEERAAIDRAKASVKEQPAIDSAAVSIKET